MILMIVYMHFQFKKIENVNNEMSAFPEKTLIKKCTNLLVG